MLRVDRNSLWREQQFIVGLHCFLSSLLFFFCCNKKGFIIIIIIFKKFESFQLIAYPV